MATACTKSVSEVSDVFDCSICLEKLKIPKYLPCLHTFCETCIQSYIESTAAYTDQTQQTEFWIACPVCRSTVTCTDTNITIKSWAKRLPINHLIMSLIDSDIYIGEDKTKKCTSCERRGESVPAELWCKQCSDALCGSCNTYHSTFRPLMNHEILPLENIMESEAMVPDIDEPCSFHRGKYLEVYCLDHRKLCCSICFATQHRTCSEVMSIEEVGQRQGVQSSAKTLLDNMSKIAEMVEEAIKEKSDNIHYLDCEQAAEIDAIALAIEDIKHLLDSLYQSFKKNVKVTHDEQNSKLLAISEHLKRFKRTVSDDCQLLKAVITQGNKKQMFLTSENLRHQIMDQFSRIGCRLETDKTLCLKFTRNKVLKSISDMKNLVNIDVISTDTKTYRDVSDAIKQLNRVCLEDLFGSEMNKSCDSMLSGNPFNWKVDRTLAINTKEVGEIASCISGGTFLEDGKLVLTDMINTKLKVYDKLGKHYTSRIMTSRLYDVTRSVEPQMFYVTHDDNTYNSRYVSLCKLTDGIIIVSTFQAPDGVQGVSYADEKLVLSSGSHVYTVSRKDGTIFHKISLDTHSSTKYVVASRKSGRLVHRDGSAIVCRTLQLDRIFRYRDKKLSKPRGVAFDLQDNVYVCDSNRVIQIKQDGSEGRILPIHFLSVKEPHNIGFQSDGKTFFVSGYNNGYVEVHTFKNK